MNKEQAQNFLKKELKDFADSRGLEVAEHQRGFDVAEANKVKYAPSRP